MTSLPCPFPRPVRLRATSLLPFVCALTLLAGCGGGGGGGDEPPRRPRVVVLHKGQPFGVAAALLATGQFGAVDEFDAGASTPSAAFLSAYEAALVYGDGRFHDPVLFGDRLKDYVDGGHGVVLAAMFVLRQTPAGEGIDGQFEAAGYFAIPETPSHTLDRGGDGPVALTVHPASLTHPLVTGQPLSSPISTLGTDYWASRPYVPAGWLSLVPGAVEVAAWDDDPASHPTTLPSGAPNTNGAGNGGTPGTPTPFLVTRDLVAQSGALVRRVDLGLRLQPPGLTSSGLVVVVNSLLWVAHRL